MPITNHDELRALPDGAIVRDATGEPLRVNRPRDRNGVERWPGEVWLDRFSDEYAHILKPDGTAAGPGDGPEGIHYPIEVIA